MPWESRKRRTRKLKGGDGNKTAKKRVVFKNTSEAQNTSGKVTTVVTAQENGIHGLQTVEPAKEETNKPYHQRNI